MYEPQYSFINYLLPVHSVVSSEYVDAVNAVKIKQGEQIMRDYLPVMRAKVRSCVCVQRRGTFLNTGIKEALLKTFG